MASTYWLSFRIADDAGYEQRREALYQAIDKICPAWWVESTSLIVFSSEKSSDQVAAIAKAAISPGKDLVVVGMTDFKTLIVVGHCENFDTLKSMAPFAKRG